MQQNGGKVKNYLLQTVIYVRGEMVVIPGRLWYNVGK